MPVDLGTAYGESSIGTEGAEKSISSLSSKLSETGKALSVGVTAPLLGAAGAAIKFSNDFNEGMANVASLGVASDRVIELKDNLQQMAVETGQTTDDLSGGLYQVVSAFGDTADTASILEINAKAAAAGLATTTEAINLTSAVTKGYGDTSAEAVQKAADLAQQTVILGQTTFPELAGSVGKVVPLMASLGGSQEELFATMATATGVTGNAAEVATQLRGVLQSLMAPTADMTTLMNGMGYETGAAMLQGEGLDGVLKAITEAAAASGQPLQKYIGSIEGQTLALALAGPQADTYKEKLAAMGNAAGASSSAFDAQTQGINANGFAMKQLGIQAAVIMQKLGDGLAPALGLVLAQLQPLADGAINLANQFAAMDAGTQTMIVAALGLVAALGPIMAMLPAIGAAVAALASPLGLVVVAVAALGAAWATNFGGIQDITAQAMAAITPALQGVLPAVSSLWYAFNNLALVLADAGAGSIEAEEALNLFPAALQPVIAGAQQLWIQFAAVGAQLQAFFAPAVARVQEAFVGLPVALQPLMPKLAELGAAFVSLVSSLQPFVQLIGAGLAIAVAFGINTFAAVIANLPGIVGPIIDQVTASITLVSTVLTEVVTLVKALIAGDWSTVWASAKTITQTFVDYYRDSIRRFITLTTTVFKAVYDAVINTLSDLGVDIGPIMNGIQSAWETAWNAIKDALAPVKTAVEGVQDVIEAFSSWIGGITFPNPFAPLADAAGSVMDAAGKLLGGGGNAVGTSSFAGGATMVGERGPEMVVLPSGSRVLTNGQTNNLPGGSGTTINVNLGGVTVNKDMDLQRIGYGLANQIAAALG